MAEKINPKGHYGCERMESTQEEKETRHYYSGSLDADSTTTTEETPDWCYPLDPLTVKEAIEIGVGSIHHARSCIRIALASLPSGDSRLEVARRIKRCLDHLDSALDAVA